MERIIFSLLVFLAPTQLAYHFWPDWAHIFGIRVDYLSPSIYLTDLLVISLLASWLVHITTQNSKVKSSLQDKQNYNSKVKAKIVFIICIALFILLNISLAKSPQAAIFKWVKILELIFLGYYAATNKKLKMRNWFVKPLVFSTTLFSLIGIIQFLIGRTIGGPLYFLGERSFTLATPGIALVTLFGREFMRGYSTFPHPNAMAGYFLVGGLTVLFYEKRGKLKTICLLATSLVLLLSFSLGAYLAALFALLAFLLRGKGARLFVFLAILLSIALPVLISNFFPSIKTAKNIQERISLMEISEKVFAENPIIGVGLNNFFTASNSLQPVHNIFLLVLSESGIIGLLLFLYLITKSLDNSRATNNPLRGGNWKLAILVVVILVTGLADHYWLTLQQNQLLLAIIFGVSLRGSDNRL